MKKVKEFLASLDNLVTISKRELCLGIAASVLAGIVFGVFFGPKKTSIFGSYNGNGRDLQEEEKQED